MTEEHTMRLRCWSLALSFLAAFQLLSAQEQASTIQLPPPDTVGGKPLMQALTERKSSRRFSAKPIPDAILSGLLWAAFGVNRPDGHRTAPSAMNWQEIDIYVFRNDGVFLYDARANVLDRVLATDLRKETGVQDFVGPAPVNLVYVADLERTSAVGSDDATLFMGADCGAIVQNVYLFCASTGLATVARGMIDRPGLAKALNFGSRRRILLAQTVGFPEK
jgi:SagB-type dehydrogenase family enzyme